MTKTQAERKLYEILGLEVDVRQSGANVKIEWDHAPLTYKHLSEIAELFGTDAINVNSGQDAGSCCSHLFDFVELTVRGVDLE